MNHPFLYINDVFYQTVAVQKIFRNIITPYRSQEVVFFNQFVIMIVPLLFPLINIPANFRLLLYHYKRVQRDILAL